MSRIVNLLFALVLLAALVIAVDPNARRKAMETVRAWEPELKQLNSKVVVNAPPLSTPEPDVRPTPIPTVTAVTDADRDEQIPVTGDENTNDKPFIQVNWDAIGTALRQFWVSLSNVRITLPPKDNK